MKSHVWRPLFVVIPLLLESYCSGFFTFRMILVLVNMVSCTATTTSPMMRSGRINRSNTVTRVYRRCMNTVRNVTVMWLRSVPRICMESSPARIVTGRPSTILMIRNSWLSIAVVGFAYVATHCCPTPPVNANAFLASIPRSTTSTKTVSIVMIRTTRDWRICSYEEA